MTCESEAATGIEIPEHLTKAMVDDSPQLKRLQNDLLVLTSFPENSTLHWRPTWFSQGEFAARKWTLHNPRNVITILLPSDHRAPTFTRRMRYPLDQQPVFIKTDRSWRLYCLHFGVPLDFLNENQIRLMRLGLRRNQDGELSAPPVSPLYPEPQPLNQGNYLLHPSLHRLLPRKFQAIDEDQVITILSTGEVRIALKSDFIHDQSQWTQYAGTGERIDDMRVSQDPLKYEGNGRRWCYLPWTEEQKESCR